MPMAHTAPCCHGTAPSSSATEISLHLGRIFIYNVYINLYVYVRTIWFSFSMHCVSGVSG